jgi:hypothetical protein
MKAMLGTSRQRASVRARKVLAVALLTAAILVGLPSPASAQDTGLSAECITVNGQRRGCAKDILVRFGNGIYWSTAGSTRDLLVDNGNVTLEVRLDRKWSSNTSWMIVSRSIDRAQYYSYTSVSGYDPTYGAWVRLCTNLSTGKWCNPARYVVDRS